MKIINISLALVVANLLPACADQEGASQQPEKAEKAEINMDQYKWKNRIIFTYPKDEASWVNQQKLYQQKKAQIDARDLIIIRVDTGLGNKNDFAEADRLAIVKKYKLTPGTHLLIGKDGGEKRRQTGQMNLDQLFNLIDQMPMRRAEMEESGD